jgi:hypothetical protein
MNISGKLSKHQKTAIQYFADQLFTKQMQRNIALRITFTQNAKYFGETEIDDYNSKGEPREFTIIVKKNIGDEETLRTISHEMVHCKQYVYKELNEQMTLWHGRKVCEDDYAYFDRPWEKEAHEVGNQLYEDFINDNSL